MSWLILVGGLVALALAVHFFEERKSRAILLARRQQRAAAASELHRFSMSREVTETWAVDLKTMVVELTRSDEAGVTTFELERRPDGSWHRRRSSDSEGGVAPVPAALSEQLEQRFQRLPRSGSPASG